MRPSHLLLIGLSIINQSLWAKETVSVCSVALPGGLIHQDGTGFIPDQVKQALSNTYDVDFRIYPKNRAVRNFELQLCDILAVHSKGFFPGYLEVDSGFSGFLAVFVSEKEKLENYQLSDKGRYVSIFGNSRMVEGALRDVDITYVETTKQAIRMLELGRMDYFVYFVYLVTADLTQMENVKLYFKPELKIHPKKIVYFLQNTQKMEVVEAVLRENVIKSMCDGSFKKLLENYGVYSWFVDPEYANSIGVSLEGEKASEIQVVP